MNNYFPSSSEELCHHGVKGMRWGVRRYQNADGTLTPAGKKRLTDNAGWYMNPKYGDKHSTNRKAVSQEYENAYHNLMKKHGVNSHQMDGAEASWELETRTGQRQLNDKLWNSFIDRYSSATLKDLKLKDSDSARKYVKSLYAKDLAAIEGTPQHAKLKAERSRIHNEYQKRLDDINKQLRKQFASSTKRQNLIDEYVRLERERDEKLDGVWGPIALEMI